ncbi:MAG: exonuclease domain-containing protein [Flavobacteriales bacterium]
MPFLILDLEMSGSEAEFHDIIQIGAVLADDNWNKLSEFETLVYPDHEETFSSYAEAVHGISLDDLKDAPQSFEALENLEAWIRKTLRKTSQEKLHEVILCGQSIINDIHFLKVEYQYLNLSWPFAYKMIDLMSFTLLMKQILEKNQRKAPEKLSLKAVAAHFGIFRQGEQHNALEDARITFECFKKYFELAASLKFKD